MLEPAARALLGRGASCLNDVGTYLLGTVGQGCRLFKWYRIYLLCTVEQVCRLFKGYGNIPPGHCKAGAQAFPVCWNIPPGNCGAGVQAVYSRSEPTSRSQTLFGRGACCLSGVGSYLLSSLEGRNWILFYFNLRAWAITFA